MDIKKLADVKDRFADYEKIFNSGDYDKAADILSAILESFAELRMHLRRLYAGILLTLIHILVLQNVIRILICCRDILMLQSRHTDSVAAAQRWQDITEIWDFIMLQGIILRRQECATPTAIYIIRQIMLIMSLNILSRH